jgi:hypothetical protein
VGENLGDDRGIFDGRDESEAAAASGAREDVDGVIGVEIEGLEVSVVDRQAGSFASHSVRRKRPFVTHAIGGSATL